MATTRPKAKTARIKAKETAKVPPASRLKDIEIEAIEAGIKALEQKARNIESMGPFGSKGPVMYCQYAIYDLRRLIKRLG